MLTLTVQTGVVESGRPSLMFVGDFESGDLKKFGDKRLQDTLSKVEIVTSPVRAGTRALKLTLDRTRHSAVRNYRTDFWLRGMSRRFRMGEEYWYGFSTQLPHDWQPDTQAELFAQWIPVVGGKGGGETGGGPALAVYIYGNQYRVKKRWSPESSAYKNLWRGPVIQDAGEWVDWIFHVKWSTASDGQVEVWKNKVKIVSHSGRNCYGEEYAPYFKFGIYKWPWRRSPELTPSKVERRVLFVDEIRIGDHSGSYDAVAPVDPVANP